jgi:hypothetical protein
LPLSDVNRRASKGDAFGGRDWLVRRRISHRGGRPCSSLYSYRRLPYLGAQKLAPGTHLLVKTNEHRAEIDRVGFSAHQFASVPEITGHDKYAMSPLHLRRDLCKIGARTL